MYSGSLDITAPLSHLYDRVFWSKFCREQHNLVYLKVHKTGSSTMANIIQRFGFNRKLNFALPNKKQGEVRYNYFGKVGESLNSSGIKPSRKNAKEYNLLCNHVVYNWKAFNSIFPRTRSSYVTMLREPLKQFTSSLLYFRHAAILNASTENLTHYLENIESYEPKNPYLSFLRNRQSLDLGIPASKLRDRRFVNQYIEILDKAFDLVLVMEYFDESLVMMKRRLCWSMKDILYMRRNKGYRKFDFEIGQYEKQLLKDWLLADNMLYDHFYTKFHYLLKKDPLIMEEAHWFKIALKKTQTFCGGNTSASEILIESSPFNEAFKVTSLDCAYMKLSELDFLDLLLNGH